MEIAWKGRGIARPAVRVNEWHQGIFAGDNAKSVAAKLVEEALEPLHFPDDLSESADCVIVLLAWCGTTGHTVANLVVPRSRNRLSTRHGAGRLGRMGCGGMWASDVPERGRQEVFLRPSIDPSAVNMVL